MLRIRGMRRPHGRIVRRRILHKSVSITPILHPCRSMCESDLLGCVWAIIRTSLTSFSHAKTSRKNRSNLSSSELQFSLGSFSSSSSSSSSSLAALLFKRKTECARKQQEQFRWRTLGFRSSGNHMITWPASGKAEQTQLLWH